MDQLIKLCIKIILFPSYFLHDDKVLESVMRDVIKIRLKRSDATSKIK